MKEGPGIIEGVVKTAGALPVKAVEWLVPSQTVRDTIDFNRDALYKVAGVGVLAGVGMAVID